MRKRTIKTIAAITALGVTSLGIEFISPGGVAAAATSTSATVTCDGVTGDNAGYLQAGKNMSSKELVAQLGSLGGSTNISIPTTVTIDAPSRVKKDSGDYDASFNFAMALPSSLTSLISKFLGKDAVTLKNVKFGVDYSGAQTGSLAGSIASVNVGTSSPSFGSSVSGKISSSSSGRVNYAPGAISLQVVIDGTVSLLPGSSIGTLTLSCSAQAALGGTSIMLPGAPNVPGTIETNPVAGGNTVTTPLFGRSDITADSGNPILWDTLRLVSGSNGARIENGQLIQPTSQDGGDYSATVEICGASRTIAAIPGTNAVQTLSFPTDYHSEIVNEHPLSMKLTFDGQTTSAISLTEYTNFFGQKVTDPTDQFQATGKFSRPSATAIRVALEALPNVGAGNVTVTDVSNGTNAAGYRIEFVGALANKSQPTISVADWTTWPSYDSYNELQALITAFTSGSSTTASVPYPNVDLDGFWALGTVTLLSLLDQGKFFDNLGSAIMKSVIAGVDIDGILKGIKQLFPQPPTLASTVQGVETIPASETGQLCSQFEVRAKAVSLKFLFLLYLASLPKTAVQGCTVTKVPTKVRVKVKGKYRTVTRTVTKKTGSCTTAKTSKKKSTKKKSTKKSTTKKSTN